MFWPLLAVSEREKSGVERKSSVPSVFFLLLSHRPCSHPLPLSAPKFYQEADESGESAKKAAKAAKFVAKAKTDAKPKISGADAIAAAGEATKKVKAPKKVRFAVLRRL